MKWVQCFCHFSGWIGGIQRCRRTWQINNKWQKLDSNLGLSNYILCCKPLCYTVWRVNNTHTKLFSILAAFTVIELNYALLCKHQGIFIYKEFFIWFENIYDAKKKNIYHNIKHYKNTKLKELHHYIQTFDKGKWSRKWVMVHFFLLVYIICFTNSLKWSWLSL